MRAAVLHKEDGARLGPLARARDFPGVVSGSRRTRPGSAVRVSFRSGPEQRAKGERTL